MANGDCAKGAQNAANIAHNEQQVRLAHDRVLEVAREMHVEIKRLDDRIDIECTERKADLADLKQDLAFRQGRASLIGSLVGSGTALAVMQALIHFLGGK